MSKFWKESLSVTGIALGVGLIAEGWATQNGPAAFFFTLVGVATLVLSMDWRYQARKS